MTLAANQEKALEKVASIFDSGWKIAAVFVMLGGALASCVLAWNQIFVNQQSDVNIIEYVDKELALRDRRGNNRYDRALQMGHELQQEIEKQAEHDLEQAKEHAYLQGQFDMYVEMNKK